MNWWLLALPLPFFFIKKARAMTPENSDYDFEQLPIVEKIRAEATRQGVPVEYALANAEIESNFRNLQNNAGGASYGPMQVNKVNLKPGETIAQLQNVDFNIKHGVEILRKYLVKANGDTYKARVMYFCGPGLCGGNPPVRLKTRWATAVAKWQIPSNYPQFSE